MSKDFRSDEKDHIWEVRKKELLSLNWKDMTHLRGRKCRSIACQDNLPTQMVNKSVDNTRRHTWREKGHCWLFGFRSLSILSVKIVTYELPSRIRIFGEEIVIFPTLFWTTVLAWKLLLFQHFIKSYFLRENCYLFFTWNLISC